MSEIAGTLHQWQPETMTEHSYRTSTAIVAAVGDLMLGDSPIPAGYGFRSRYPGMAAREALEGLRQTLAGADVVFGNLETQLTPRGVGRNRLARDMMRGDPEYALLLRDLGFNVLAVANNHAMQHGPAAFADTVDTLRKAGIEVAGIRGEAPWTAKPVRCALPSGVVVGVLAYSFRPRQYGTVDACYAEGVASSVLADVGRLRGEVDHVVVSLHWGEEFTTQPSATEVDFARRVIGAGAALLLGHHPHVVRPVVLDGSGCIAYSLGNAASDMIWQPTFRQGIVLRCRLGGESPEAEIITITTDHRYRVEATNRLSPVLAAGDVPGLDETEYQRAISESLRSYRRAALRHVLLNLWRSPIPVTAALFAQKLRNLLDRVFAAERPV